jgi:pimeloyl-ACP methyl ester carboxylesterase
MKRSIFASVLAASTLWFTAPAFATVPPPLPAAASSFNSGSLHVDVYGTHGKPALVFIPGLTCGPWEWSGEIARFAPDYTIYALTLPGFDGQPATDGDLFAKVSADFWSLLQTRNIQKPIVIGHSLGGTLAFMLAEQHSDRLRAIIAVDGMPVFPGLENMAVAQRNAMGAQMAAMMAGATHDQFEAAEKTYVLPNLMMSAQDVAQAAALAARSDPKASGAWMQQDFSMDLRPELKSVSAPVLEVTSFDPNFDPKGPAHIATSVQKQAYYASLLAGDSTAKVEVVENSRHFIMYDQPQALHADIAQFIGTLH